MTSSQIPLDSIDLKSLAILMHRGRTTWSELAGVLGLSPPAAAERVKRLEERGIIKGFLADIDPEALGLSVLAFVHVRLVPRERIDQFTHWVKTSDCVQECHHVTGDCDYFLKLRCKNIKDLESITTQELKAMMCVQSLKTTISYSTVKDTRALPTGVQHKPTKAEVPNEIPAPTGSSRAKPKIRHVVRRGTATTI